MNIDRINKLADLIETLPHTSYEAREGFSMEALTHQDCGTPCCIAGWAYWEEEGRPSSIHTWDVSNDRVADYLGIGSSEAYRLCYPHEAIHQDNWPEITPAQAASVLRNLAKTGEVDWSQVVKEL